LTSGRGALFANPDPLASEPYLVIADLDGGTQWARIDLAAPISLAEIESLYGDHITQAESVVWDEKAQVVRASRRRQLDALVLSEQALSKPDPSMVLTALLQGIRQAGLAALAWTPELQQWRARVRFLRRVEGTGSQWPDLSDDTLLRTLDQWLGPYLEGLTTLERATRFDLSQPVHALLSWDQQRRLDRQAPTHLTVPSGSKIRIEYDTPDVPVVAVRLQEMFGCKDTPRVADGTVPLMVHLLSPARRPVQVTRDLGSFWAHAYHDVKKELRGRYPKHHWPDDPLTALPTAKTKRRR
jgi:ATP-dependent helicase HrpB